MSIKVDGEALSPINDSPWLLWLEEETKSSIEDGDKDEYDQWVNFSVFLARCTASGLDRDYEDPIPYPSRDLEAALEKNQKHGLKRDYTILAAVQYILLADHTLYEDFIGNAAEGSKRKTWGLGKWPLWTKKLAEAAAEYEENGKTELAAATKKAHEKMASYHI